MNEIQKKSNELKKRQEAQAALTSKIKMMESKLLVGGKSIVDKTSEQERALEERRRELADQRAREREMLQKLEEKDGDTFQMKETHSSLQEEVDVKTKKLKKIYGKLQQVKSEITDLQEEYITQRQQLEQTQEDLTRDLKFKMLLLENFMPLDERNKITNRCFYDEENDEWKLKPITENKTETMTKRPVSAIGNRRPISEYARVAAAIGGNPRYKAENIIQIELDLPNRTTRDYEGPAVAPRVQAALDAALQDEEDITLDANALLSKKKVNSKRQDKQKTRSRSKRPESAISPESSQGELFPKARGLVSRQQRY